MVRPCRNRIDIRPRPHPPPSPSHRAPSPRSSPSSPSSSPSHHRASHTSETHSAPAYRSIRRQLPEPRERRLPFKLKRPRHTALQIHGVLPPQLSNPGIASATLTPYSGPLRYRSAAPCKPHNPPGSVSVKMIGVLFHRGYEATIFIPRSVARSCVARLISTWPADPSPAINLGAPLG